MSKTLIIDAVTHGADPELFVINRFTGAFMPSFDLIGGTKTHPRPTEEEGYGMQEDNVLVEFNIPPCQTLEAFRTALKKGQTFLDDALRPYDAITLIKSSTKFLPEMLEDPRAAELGCMPDQNAWYNGAYNPKPMVPEDGLRSAGGHIHIGYNIVEKAFEKDFIDVELVKLHDKYLGVPSIMMDRDMERRRLYGKAGAYREKEYGMEYRTLSSFWLASDKLIDWAYNQSLRAIEAFNNKEFVGEREGGMIVSAINAGDTTIAQGLIDQYQLKVA